MSLSDLLFHHAVFKIFKGKQDLIHFSHVFGDLANLLLYRSV